MVLRVKVKPTKSGWALIISLETSYREETESQKSVTSTIRRSQKSVKIPGRGERIEAIYPI